MSDVRTIKFDPIFCYKIISRLASVNGDEFQNWLLLVLEVALLNSVF